MRYLWYSKMCDGCDGKNKKRISELKKSDIQCSFAEEEISLCLYLELLQEFSVKQYCITFMLGSLAPVE